MITITLSVYEEWSVQTVRLSSSRKFFPHGLTAGK